MSGVWDTNEDERPAIDDGQLMKALLQAPAGVLHNCAGLPVGCKTAHPIDSHESWVMKLSNYKKASFSFAGGEFLASVVVNNGKLQIVMSRVTSARAG